MMSTQNHGQTDVKIYSRKYCKTISPVSPSSALHYSIERLEKKEVFVTESVRNSIDLNRDSPEFHLRLETKNTVFLDQLQPLDSLYYPPHLKHCKESSFAHLGVSQNPQIQQQPGETTFTRGNIMVIRTKHTPIVSM